MMNLSAIFIRRPVATTLLTLGLVLTGLLAFRLLPTAPLPEVDYPTIFVSANLPGADPVTMSTSVAAPLERQFGRIAGVTEMTSSSGRGSTYITLQFDLSRDANGAARDVQAAINAARSSLPANMPASPSYRKVNSSDSPILILTLTSESISRAKLYDVASSVFQQTISQVRGVGQVVISGSSLPAVRVELNPLALNKYGVGLDDVRTVIASANINRPKGEVGNGEKNWQIQTNDQMKKAEEYLPLVVSYKNGRALQLKDVATAHDSVENLRSVGLANGNKPCAMVIVYRQPGANIVDTVNKIKELMPQMAAALPASVDVDVLVDRSPPVIASLHDAEFSLVLSALLVVLVVLLFLGDIRATLIPGAAVAVSIIGTFGVMYLCGYSLNNLSLMALTIATGFVADDAIVVVENVNRYREMGKSAFQAALDGSREIAFTVLSMSVSLVAVFIPILMMGDIVGRLFREFAIVLSAAIMVSMIVSLTLTPMMCATMLRSGRLGKRSRFLAVLQEYLERMRRGYEVSLKWALGHPRLMMALLVMTMAGNVWLFMIVPKGFFPEQDNGRIHGSLLADQDVSFQSMEKKFAQAIEIISRDPDVESVAGNSISSKNNYGEIFIALKPLKQRSAGMGEVCARLRWKLSVVPGASAYFKPVQDVRIGGRATGSLYQYTLQGSDLEELIVWSEKLKQHLTKYKQLAELNSNLQNRGREVALAIDRPTAARLGVSTKGIDDALYNAFGQRQVSIYYEMLNQYRVVMEVDPRFWQSPEILKEVYVPSKGGAQVPLSAFSRHEPRESLLTVAHQGQFPAVTLSFSLRPGVALGDAVELIESARNQIGLPGSIYASFQGTAKAFKSAVENQPLLILAALVSVYIVLGVLYESFIHPVTIISTLPSAGFGAVAALILFRGELNLIAFIGVILLIGIVKKNGIMMVDFAIAAERREGKPPEEAIREACLMRFRPIMMTTMAALLGAVPLAFGMGEGAELRRPLGISIVGGLLFSQLMTLYTTPVVYLYMDRLRLWLMGLKKRIKSAPV